MLWDIVKFGSHSNSNRGSSVITCVVLQALAGEASLSAATHSVRPAWFGVAEVDLRLAVVPREAGGTAAAQPGDGVDGSEEDGIRRDERRQAVELQHGHALHVVLARLPKADVVVEGEDFLRGDPGKEAAVQVQPLLQLLRAEKLPPAFHGPAGPPPGPLGPLPRRGHGHGQADVEDAGADVRVVLDVKDDDVFGGGGEDAGDAVQELGEQQGEEALLGGVGQPQRDAVGQHFIGDDGDLEETLR